MDLSAAVHHQLHHRFLNHNHHHNHQEMDSESLDSIIASSKQQQQAQQSAITSEGASAQGEKNQSTKPRPADEEAQKCPRCDSSNTKFCYYNNYSLTQPRYFCKSCRRYWTKGGTLRNVPVGGGCRKSHKRPSSPSSLLLKRPHHISTSSISTPPLQYGNGGSFDHSLFHHHPHHADVNSHAFSFLDSLRQSGSGLFHGLGYGEVDQGQFAGYGGDVVKQEGGALWGFPWQVMNGGGGASINNASSSEGGESSYGRGNGLIGNSAWQGFINTPPAALI